MKDAPFMKLDNIFMNIDGIRLAHDVPSRGVHHIKLRMENGGLFLSIIHQHSPLG